MLDWRRLQDDCTECVAIERTADVGDAVVAACRARKKVGVSGAAPLSLPAGGVALLREAIEQLPRLEEAAAAVATIRHPLRVIALANDRAFGGKERNVALVGFHDCGGVRIGTILRITQAVPPKGRPPEVTKAEVLVSRELDAFGFPVQLERLWLEAGPPGREIEKPSSPRPATAVWLGIPGDEGYRAGCEEEASAMLAVRGLRVEVIPDPQANFPSARDKAIANARDVLVVVGGATISPAGVQIAEEFRRRFPQQPLVIQHDAGVEEIFSFIRLELDEALDRLDRDNEPRVYESVVEVVEDAARAYASVISIWKTAHNAAQRSQFPRPDEVHAVIAAINEYGLEYAHSLASGSPMGPPESFFGSRGFKYRAHESESTMNQHGGSRTFVDGERALTVDQHITVGGGGLAIQIFFHVESAAEVRTWNALPHDERSPFIALVYCGPHLPYATQRT